MLDAETKRRIDTARDILVGKLPDPMSQVEQITIALIYKFMDDMDAEAEEMGGKRTFFSGEFERYGWASLMDVSLGGNETLNRYAEGIEKMNQNPNIPQFFRDIFKNAFLPYRDPVTLKMFLKTINEFKYDHSERLGDAFEYLLSIMSSQGDAGQFRTPRHIIDFMVALVDPKKEERVLDPACGTAGFLISAYRHILTAERENAAKGEGMTPDERKRLMENFEGYDISPDMVRLSLVNLYLHGFQTPKIYEYDTLTSEDRWNDFADVIMANPPFMSPKGGIRPHRRFAVESNRSEVLFVDYIMEHLTPNGRAAVIVPEGIIFQSGKAYKALRKKLVEEDYLVGVISLPAGVFNPYSGVKTSILWIDRALAKRAKEVVFCKIEHDGFDLGAQRRPNGKDDIPGVTAVLLEYKTCLPEGRGFGVEGYRNISLVEKGRLGEDGDYALNVEKFLVRRNLNNNPFPIIEIGELCEILDRKRIPIREAERKKGDYPYYGATGILDYVDGYIFDEKLVLVGEDGAKWGKGEKTAFIAEGRYWVNNHAHVLRPKPDKIIDNLLVHLLNEMDISPYITGVTVPKLNQEKLRSIKIPIPPMDLQEEIVEEIEGYQKIIDGARMVVENYRPRIDVDPSWPVVKLGEVVEIVRGASPRPINDFITDDKEGVNWIKIGDAEIGSKYITSTKQKITLKGAEKSRKVNPGDFILSNSMSFGRPYILQIDGYVHDGWLVLRSFVENLDKDYLFYILSSDMVVTQFKKAATGGVVNNLNSELVRKIEIPLPEKVVQRSIVKTFEEEEKYIDSAKNLISLYEKKIRARIARVWGE